MCSSRNIYSGFVHAVGLCNFWLLISGELFFFFPKIIISFWICNILLQLAVFTFLGHRWYKMHWLFVQFTYIKIKLILFINQYITICTIPFITIVGYTNRTLTYVTLFYLLPPSFIKDFQNLAHVSFIPNKMFFIEKILFFLVSSPPVLYNVNILEHIHTLYDTPLITIIIIIDIAICCLYLSEHT